MIDPYEGTLEHDLRVTIAWILAHIRCSFVWSEGICYRYRDNDRHNRIAHIGTYHKKDGVKRKVYYG